jgi:hypothetical protein
MAADLETRQEYELSHGTARYWAIELDLADDEEREWREEGREVIERYRSEGSPTLMGREKKFNILWSNVETLKSSLFGRMAKPDVRRRYRDRGDKAGREVAIILERALEYGSDVYDYQSHIEAAVEDYLLPGRGVVWVTYEPVIVEVDGIETIGDQRCKMEYVHWEDYRESPAKRPEDVRWKARRHLLNREQLRDGTDVTPSFDKWSDVPLDWSPDDGSDYEDAFKRAEVWEVWDKDENKRVYVVKGYPEIVGESETYNLENFFPTPDPIVAVRTNDSGVPVPEYRLYKDQADELDRVTTRINRLVEALKRRGVYDASVPELARLADAGDNEFIPSENYASLTQGGGLKGAFQTEDMTTTAQAIVSLYGQRDRLVQTIYEITGISDVIRGSTDPRETATAQRIKGQFGSMRMRRRQDKIQKYIRDLMRIKAEIIAENYEPHILERMTGIKGVDPMLRQQVQFLQQAGQPIPQEVLSSVEGPTWDEMLEIMRNDKARSYHIDVETDSTVFEDANKERMSRIEFVNTMGAYLERALAVVQASPELTPMAFEALAFMVRGFKVGRSFEDVIEETKGTILEAQKQMQQQEPPPDPKMMEVQQKAQTKQAELQMDSQLGQAKLQQEGQLKVREQDQDFALKQREQMIDAELKARRDGRMYGEL